MFTPVDIQRLQNVIQCSWSDDTHGVYGSGPLVFHVWYDKRGLLKEERTRASGASIASAVSSLAGGYSTQSPVFRRLYSPRLYFYFISSFLLPKGSKSYISK
ncbi:unnamed protein product [Somion occarium]|uniref:Uncharacterized protein n=1 Tax=Somion occarium TaxID=3059160 RepID=A0ABP1CR40_9APHY